MGLQNISRQKNGMQSKVKKNIRQMKYRKLFYVGGKCAMNFECNLNKYYWNWLWKHRLCLKQYEAMHLSKRFIKQENEPLLYKIIL